MKIITYPLFEDSLRRALSDTDTPEDLTLIQLEELSGQSHQLSKFKGLDWVLEHAQEGKPIVMMSVSMAYIANERRFQAAMAYPNVSFVPLPLELNNLKEKIEEAVNKTRPANELAVALVDVPMTQDELRILKHDLHHVQNGYKDKEEWAQEARKLFGDLPFEELEKKVESEERPTSSIFEGQNLKGVFVDIEGSLMQNGEINQDLVTELEERAKEKPITIWTDGDIKKLSGPIRRQGLLWQIVPKTMFIGATAEEVYDDLPQEEFEERYGIKAEIYHQVEPKEDIREGNPQGPTRI